MIVEQCRIAACRYKMEPGEFMGSAAEAVLWCLDRYDPLRGCSFATFARNKVATGIVDQVRVEGDRKRFLVDKLKAITDATERVERRKECAPTLPELAAELGKPQWVTERWAKQTRAGCRQPMEVLNELRVVPTAPPLETTELLDILTRALTDTERYILWSYYAEGLSACAIGEHLGRSKSHIGHVLDRIGGKLRARIDATKMGGYGTAALRTEKERKNGRKPDRAPVLHGRVAV